jgi:methylaspartate ammonia-lyase
MRSREAREFVAEAMQHLEFLSTVMRELLRGRPVDPFRNLAEEVDGLVHDGRRLHTALRYGITQALLHAAALSNRCTMTEIVSRECGYSLHLSCCLPSAELRSVD